MHRVFEVDTCVRMLGGSERKIMHLFEKACFRVCTFVITLLMMEAQEHPHAHLSWQKVVDTTVKGVVLTGSLGWTAGITKGCYNWVQQGIQHQSFQTATKYSLKAAPLGLLLSPIIYQAYYGPRNYRWSFEAIEDQYGRKRHQSYPYSNYSPFDVSKLEGISALVGGLCGAGVSFTSGMISIPMKQGTINKEIIRLGLRNGFKKMPHGGLTGIALLYGWMSLSLPSLVG